MMVKICGITRREDAEAAVEAGATALGFVFYPNSPRFVTPEQAEELGRGLAVWKVGVFVDETAASIESTMRAAKLDVAQIYGGDLPAGVRVWEAIRVGSGVGQASACPERAVPGAAPIGQAEACPTFRPEAVLLDGMSNGQSFNWNFARGAADKVIVAGGLDASNVADAIRAAQPWGVDASSRLEASPGIKDHEKVKRFIQEALNA